MSDISYKSGAHFLRDTAASHGLNEAFGICGRYLKAQMKAELADAEKKFCHELFDAMFDASVQTTDPAKIVYPYTFKEASERTEGSYYHAGRECNTVCARAIDKAIGDSHYKEFHYNLRLAAMKVVGEYGFERVNAVLAQQIKRSEWDGHYSQGNKTWALRLASGLPEDAFKDAYLNAHPILVEDFTRYAREMYADLGAEAFALPGRPEAGTVVHDYEVTRSIFFNDQRGFAIGHNSGAPSPFVCWQFTLENGVRDFYWGHYAECEKSAADNLKARVIVHMDGGAVREIPNPLPSETLPAKTLPSERPSVLAQIREAKAAPKVPHKPKSQQRNKGGAEL